MITCTFENNNKVSLRHITAVRREVMEESGWETDGLKLFRINDNPNRPHEDRQNVDIIFIANAIKKTGASDEEVSLLQWFDLDKIKLSLILQVS